MSSINNSKHRLNHQWLQQKVRALFSVSQYCGLCLETAGNFYPMETEFAINECYSTKPLKDVINDVLNCDIEDITTSDIICEQCTEKTIHSYIFIKNTKKIFKIINSCVSDLLCKANDLDNELTEDHSYGDADVMIVLEYDMETYKNVNQITSGNETILSSKPILKNELVVPYSDPLNIQFNVSIQKNREKPQEPVAVPILRKTRYPRTKSLIKNEPETKTQEPQKVENRAVSLEGGKIVITPLKTNNSTTLDTYTCKSCDSVFTSHKYLKEHEKLLHNLTIFKCRFCDKKYNSQQYLDVHYKETHSKTRCRLCQELLDNNNLNSHIIEKHPKQVYKCELCELAYFTVEKLETHMKSAHFNLHINSDSKTQCVMCLRDFREVELKSHKCKFTCLQCLNVPCIHYSYLMSYREQVLSHATKVKCIDCDYTTKRKEHLITHVNREHLDHHPFTCHDCGTQFYTKLSLKTHIIQFHQDFKCQYCDQDFKNPVSLHNHREICKNIARVFSCEKCVASFDTEHDLRKHQRFCHSDFIYPCSLCKKEYLTSTSLREHHARVHNVIQYRKRSRFIECTLCDITFRSTKEMFAHEKLHDPNEKYPCQVCPKTFKTLNQVYIHKQRHYSQQKKCPGCNKMLQSSYFPQHKTTCPYIIKGSRELPFICVTCNKAFHSESFLKAHIQNHATAIPCEYCGKPIKPLSMKRHIKYKHSEYLTDTRGILWSCEYCSYTTKKKLYLENHTNKIHRKIKPYICEICSKAFCGKSRLDEHLRTHNSNYVCYCTHCGKKFANKVCLKMHMRRHTGEKPYQCNICQEKFRSASIMKAHRLKKHLDKTIQCPLCDSMYHLAVEMRFHVKKVHWKSSEPFDYKKIVPKEFHHMFEDQRLQKLGEDSIQIELDYI